VLITAGTLDLDAFLRGDLTGDLRVDAADLVALLSHWNAPWSPGDLDGDGTVNSADLAQLLGAWSR